MIKNIWLSILLACCVVLGSSYGGRNVSAFYSEHETIAYKVTEEVARALSKRYNLDPCGVGGSIQDDVKQLALSFNCYRTLSIEEARDLIVSCALEYLEAINDDPELKPHLHDYPFTADNIEFSIFISYPDRSDVEPGELCSVYILKDRITYQAEGRQDPLEIVHRESFEEAVRLVKKSKG